MTYIVSITSQGQISIPAKLRRKLGLEKHKKASVREEDGKLIIEPVKDFLELGGSLSHKAIKGKSIDEIMKLEDAAIAQGFVERYQKQMESMQKSKSKK